MEANYTVNKLRLSPIFKYYRKSQAIEQSNFLGHLSSDSRTWRKYTYESIDVGALLKYKVTKSSCVDVP